MLYKSIVAALALAFAVTSCESKPIEQPVTATPTATAAATNGTVFDHVLVMFFENHGFKQTMSNKFWSPIINKGQLLTDYHAITHPSQPNYVATISGDTNGCKNDNYFTTDEKSVVDLMEAKGVTWRSYDESYVPGPDGACNDAQVIGDYYRKHNPFMSFSRNRVPARCANIVSGEQLQKDLTAGTFPQFSFYTPNINSDAHNKPLEYAGKWLAKWLDTYLEQMDKLKTLVVITFDEDERTEDNSIITLLVGNYTKPMTQDGTTYTHYSVTRMLEDNWDLGSLGKNDATATTLINAVANAAPRTKATDAELLRKRMRQQKPFMRQAKTNKLAARKEAMIAAAKKNAQF